MYLPPQFKAKDEAHAIALMREDPFASLISCDDEGFPCENDLDCCGDRVCRLNERGMEPLCTDP